ncbi:MAG: iron-sulfur cluster repair di-iron protein [Chitinophagaceae bacterium]|nr:iron-sulfur cluster repair di-iron protein [Chitinophagaceae bacterium]
MEILKEKKVAELVAENINSAHVFNKYGIDFCCGGGISLERASEKYGVPLNQLCQDILENQQDRQGQPAYNRWSLSFLADYIEMNHHAYVQEAITLLDEYTAKVLRVHGETFPVLQEISEVYQSLRNELVQHMMKEERILFPYIRSLEAAGLHHQNVPPSPFGTIQNPINMMESEHELAGELTARIRELTMGYCAPDWACNTFKAMYHKLKEFENDLHIHIHLENNILFPKALELESKPA